MGKPKDSRSRDRIDGSKILLATLSQLESNYPWDGRQNRTPRAVVSNVLSHAPVAALSSAST